MTSTDPPARANCFVIGAPHAGTAAVERVLRGHPDVFLSPVSEPSHFCPDIAAQKAPHARRRHPLDIAGWLGPAPGVTPLQRIGSPELYARLFAGAQGQRLIAECSSHYMSSAAAPELIHVYNPRSCIIAVLRRPLDRIRAHYATDRRQGVVSRPLLELVEDELRLGKRAHWGNSAYYLGASRYREQLLAWHGHFPAEAICMLSYERLASDPGAELDRLFAFLGIPAPAGAPLPPAEDGASWMPGEVEARRPGQRMVELFRRLLLRRRAPPVPPPPGEADDRELRRLQYLLREEGVDEGWEPAGMVRTATPARTARAWQTQARS